MNIGRILFALVVISATGVLGSKLSSSGCLPRESLLASVQSIMSQSQFNHQSWAMLVQKRNASAPGGFETILDINSQQYMQPASNNKVLTTSAAITELGPDYRWHTPFIADASNISSLRVIPKLCVAGHGDPSMKTAQLLDAVSQISNQGVKEITELIVDDTIFPPPPDTWEIGDFAYYYGAKPSSFILNEGFIDFSILPGPAVGAPASVFTGGAGSRCVEYDNQAFTVAAGLPATVTVEVEIGVGHFVVKGQIPLDHKGHNDRRALIDPNAFFQCTLVNALQLNQIVVRSVTRGSCLNSMQQAESSKVLAVIQSAPITTTMNWTLMTSDNLYTECYLRTLGAREKRRSGSPLNAQQLGLARVRELLSSLGVDVDLFQQVDGSGLSRYNLVSPAAMIATLKAIDATKYGAVYKSFLPVAGVSGSLQHRFIGTPAVGIVHAKTGTLSGVVTLSGWVDKGSGYVFSVMSNQSRQPASVVQKQGVDAIVLNIVALCE